MAFVPASQRFGNHGDGRRSAFHELAWRKRSTLGETDTGVNALYTNAGGPTLSAVRDAESRRTVAGRPGRGFRLVRGAADAGRDMNVNDKAEKS